MQDASQRCRCRSRFQVKNRCICSPEHVSDAITTSTGLPKPIYASTKDEEHDTLVTTLSNGLRVASQKKFGQFCTVGVAIDSGSRYETFGPSGVSHFIEKLAFNSSVSYASKDHVLQQLEKYGGICDCQGSRDTLIYAASIDTRGLETIVQVLSEAVFQPQVTADELDKVRQTIRFELEDIDRKPDQEQILLEMLHDAAFGPNTLGLPKLCPTQNIDLIDRDAIFKYMRKYHTPQRMVLAGVGVEHQQLCDYADKYFNTKDPIFGVRNESEEPDNSLSQYVGGYTSTEKDLSHVSIGTSPMPELAHFVLGLNSSPHQDLDDFIPTCVLNMLMGGGGSFSAGGPGKGMYTRLYTNVLNRFHWMFSATAYNHAYVDSGVFCIHASAHPSQLRDMVTVIVKEMFDMTSKVPEVELNRAKAQLQSMLLMNLESRPVVFEDVARQVLSSGFRRPPKFFIDKISHVTEEDIHRVVMQMMKSKPAVVALGDIKQMPSVEDITTGLTCEGRVPKRFTLFR